MVILRLIQEILESAKVGLEFYGMQVGGNEEVSQKSKRPSKDETAYKPISESDESPGPGHGIPDEVMRKQTQIGTYG